MLRISSYDENEIVFLSEGQKNWPKKHQGIDLIFALFIFWIANFCPQFVPRSISQKHNILNINLLQVKNDTKHFLHRKLLPRTQVEADTKRTAEVRLSDSMNLSSTKSSNNKERRSSKLLSLRRRPNGSSDARQSQFEFPRQLNVESS